MRLARILPTPRSRLQHLTQHDCHHDIQNKAASVRHFA